MELIKTDCDVDTEVIYLFFMKCNSCDIKIEVGWFSNDSECWRYLGRKSENIVCDECLTKLKNK
jgi:hypothetical protein